MPCGVTARKAQNKVENCKGSSCGIEGGQCFVAGTEVHVSADGGTTGSSTLANAGVAIGLGAVIAAESSDRARRRRRRDEDDRPDFDPHDDETTDNDAFDDTDTAIEPFDWSGFGAATDPDVYESTTDSIFATTVLSDEPQLTELPRDHAVTLATHVEQAPALTATHPPLGRVARYERGGSTSTPERVLTRARHRRSPSTKRTLRANNLPRIAALGLLCASLFFALFTWFPSDTSTDLATRKIENIRPGHRVIVDAPEDAIVADAALLADRDVNWDAGDGSGTVDGINDPLRAATDASHQHIRRSDYRLIHITAERTSASGDVEDIHVQTLQPLAWVEEHDVRRGGVAALPIDMVELGLPEGITGLVTAVLPCPTLQHGAGRLVVTTMNSLSSETVELTVITPEGDLETLRPTAGHKFYSVTRGEWLDAWDLQDGEHLNGRHGTLTVADIRRLPGTHRVYNMTVQGLHFYRVGDSGVLVHNNVECGPKAKPHQPGYLPDEAPVVRGGQNLPENYRNGSGVTVDSAGQLDGVSVQSSAYKTADEIAAGIPHKQMGQTTVGAVRRSGGDVIPTPNARNTDHATLSGITPEEASSLSRPTRLKPTNR